MALRSRAVVQTAPRTLELLEFDVPEVAADDAILRVEACGACGSDWSQYKGEYEWLQYPVVMGHEPIGTIEAIGPVAASRWGLGEGDRVAVEPNLPCGTCSACRAGSFTLCSGNAGISAYGYIPIGGERTSLWGGYADYLYLSPAAVVHRVDPELPAEIAALFNPLGAGIDWAVTIPGTSIGDTVVVLGAGQRGLSCVIAARAAGAERILVTGLERDATKLALARDLGADETLAVDGLDVAAAARELFGARGIDIVVDTTPSAADSVKHAVEMVAPGGTVVLAGAKGSNLLDGLRTDSIMLKGIRLLGARGVRSASYAAAIRLIAAGRFPIERMHTHDFSIEDADRALRVLGGEEPGESAIQLTLRP